MSEPIRIIVTAETAQAAATLQAFVAQAGAGLKSLVPAAAGAGSSLTQLRESAALTHEGFRSLESTVFLLGGTRFPGLTMGIMGATQGMRALRTTAQLTGASISTMLPILGGIAAVVGAGALLWHAYKTEEEQVIEKNNALTESYKEMPVVIERINAAVRAGALSSAQQSQMLARLGMGHAGGQPQLTLSPEQRPGQPNAQFTGRLSSSQSGIPDANDLRQTNEELVKMGILLKTVDDKGRTTYSLSPQIEAMDKIAELQKKITLENLAGFDKEREAAKQKYDDELKSLNDYIEVAGRKLDAAAAAGLRTGLASGYQTTLAEIDKKQSDAKQKEDEEIQKSYEKMLQLDAEVEKQIDQGIKEEKLEALKEVSEAQQRQRDALQEQKFDIGSDESLSPGQKADATAQILQQQIALAKTEQERIGYERELQKLTESQTFAGNMKLQGDQLVSQWGNISQTLASGAFQTIRMGIQGIAGALTSIVMGTQTAAQAFAQFGIQMLTSFISMILEAVLYAEVAVPILTTLGVLSGGSTAAAGTGITVAAVVAAQMGVAGAMAGFAAGGRPMVGGLSLVGERGPELFVPDTAGTIIPAHQTAALLRGGSGAPASGPAGLPGKTNVTNAIFFDTRLMADSLEKDSAHEQYVVDVMRRNIHRFR